MGLSENVPKKLGEWDWVKTFQKNEEPGGETEWKRKKIVGLSEKVPKIMVVGLSEKEEVTSWEKWGLPPPLTSWSNNLVGKTYLCSHHHHHYHCHHDDHHHCKIILTTNLGHLLNLIVIIIVNIVIVIVEEEPESFPEWPWDLPHHHQHHHDDDDDHHLGHPLNGLEVSWPHVLRSIHSESTHSHVYLIIMMMMMMNMWTRWWRCIGSDAKMCIDGYMGIFGLWWWRCTSSSDG